MASLAFHVTRTVRKIVKALRKQDKREEQLKRQVRRLMNPLSYFTRDPEEEREQKERTVTTYTVVSFANVASSVGALALLPGITLNMVAASVAGSHLMFDCLSDEVVGNWLSMIEHVGHKERKKLRKRLLYNAEAALEEIEETLSGGRDNNDMKSASRACVAS